MGELASERKAAYEAIFSCGLLPLMFETEPIKDEKNQIDTLVDSSDLFLGIFKHSLGKRREAFYGLSPIEYELYRFLIAHHARITQEEHIGPQALARIVEDVFKKVVDERKQNPGRDAADYGAIRDIRKQARTGGVYRDLLRNHVRLYCMESRTMASDLARFLKPFQVYDIGGERLGAGTADHMHFAQPRITLVKRAITQLSAQINNGKIKLKDRPEGVMKICASAPDRIGKLHAFLSSLFKANLNVQDVESVHEGDQLKLRAWCTRYTKESSENDCKALVKSSLQTEFSGVKASESKISLEDQINERETPIVDAEYRLKLRTLRAPGILMTVADRLRLREANVRRLVHLPTRELDVVPHQSFEFYFNMESADDEERLVNLKTLIYEIPSLTGVTSAIILNLKEDQKAPKSRSGRKKSSDNKAPAKQRRKATTKRKTKRKKPRGRSAES